MRLFNHLYVWVLIGILIGGLVGFFFPAAGEGLKPLGDGFIALIKMLIAPVIFCTIVTGMAGAGDIKKVGRVGAKALLYFETVSAGALAIGLVVVKWIKPGEGFNVDPKTLDAGSVAHYAQKAADQSTVDFLLGIIPKTILDPFTGNGDLLQVLLVSLIFGWAVTHIGKKGEPVLHLIEALSAILFALVGLVMKLAPLGAGGAVAFTIGKYGIDSLAPLASLMASFYLTCMIFVAVVLGLIAHFTGFNVFKFLRYIKDELFLVLGTSSSESALLPLMQKLEKLGCSKSVVGLVVPSGYSFNLDGTNIYLTMAALFIAQACNIDLTLTQELSLLGIAAITSNGASGVTGSGFVTLAATLAIVPEVPVAGLALILGIDRFMSEARALTNIIGNGVATIVIARWEGELDLKRLKAELR